jgi:hypothetical protein
MGCGRGRNAVVGCGACKVALVATPLCGLAATIADSLAAFASATREARYSP